MIFVTMTYDEIAEEHDKAYAKAQSSLDVINADKKAIDHFSEDYEKNGNLHSLIGKTGSVDDSPHNSLEPVEVHVPSICPESCP